MGEMIFTRLLLCFMGGSQLLASGDVYVKPEISEVMIEQVYKPLVKFQDSDVTVTLDNKKKAFELCERSYAAYLINNDNYLYIVSGKIWDKLSKIDNGNLKTDLKSVDNGVKDLYKEYVCKKISESDLYTQCDQLVEEALKSETE